MSKLTRRQLLIFFGASAGTAVLAPALENKLLGGNSSIATAIEPLSFTPVRLPHPLPIYTELPSFLATGNGNGQVLNPDKQAKLTSYTVLDDVVVPPEYERYVIVSWGDRVFPNKDEYFGYNNDYTGFVPIGSSMDDGYLWVNHEYVSYPISLYAPGTDAEDLAEFPISYPQVIGQSVPEDPTDIKLLGEFLYNLGGSVLRIARNNRNGRYAVIPSDSKNRRIHGLSGLGINSQRSDGYQKVTSWGSKSYQKGDQNYLIGTGPAAKQVFEQVNADGLGNKIIGTAYNCSGGTTPWGTILSAEENFQGSEDFFVGVTEPVLPNGSQTEYIEGTTGAVFGLVGEKYGWMVEIDPADPHYRPRKHTALGRFRHENIAFRVESEKPLVAYMGDDRRGGHTYKFVSSDRVSAPTNKKNSRLFEAGTLYVARYNPNGTGRWIALDLNTPTDPIPPSTLASVEIEALGDAAGDGLLTLPRRQGVAGAEEDGGGLGITIETIESTDEETGAVTLESVGEDTALPAYRNKRLADFYPNIGAVLVDAFLAANLIGGTPTARPEDIEVNPRNPREVFIAYTDGAPGSDGYPDSRIFIVSKYSAEIDAAQPSGGLYKIIEDSADSTGNTFRWERFAKGGEAGSEPGDGFANVDNLAFDSQGNVWGVTDMSTGSHNGVTAGSTPEAISIEHTVVGSEATSQIDSNLNVETSDLIGVFGNNFLFYIPTTGQDAGELIPFAYGPFRCEMTGPTFVGNTLIIAVQHPGEECPYSPQQTFSRDIELLSLDGNSVFNQTRTVLRGSNWPSNINGDPLGPPKSSVIGIRRKDSSNGQFV